MRPPWGRPAAVPRRSSRTSSKASSVGSTTAREAPRSGTASSADAYLTCRAAKTVPTQETVALRGRGRWSLVYRHSWRTREMAQGPVDGRSTAGSWTPAMRALGPLALAWSPVRRDLGGLTRSAAGTAPTAVAVHPGVGDLDGWPRPRLARRGLSRLEPHRRARRQKADKRHGQRDRHRALRLLRANGKTDRAACARGRKAGQDSTRSAAAEDVQRGLTDDGASTASTTKQVACKISKSGSRTGTLSSLGRSRRSSCVHGKRSAAADRASYSNQLPSETSPRSMQNSLPSGSKSVTQPRPSGRRWSSYIFAPSASTRSTSSSRARSVGAQSKWIRFFTVLRSGTRMNSSPGTGDGASTSTSSSPGRSTSDTGQPVTLLQNVARSYGSAQSTVMWRSITAPA